MKIAIAGCGYVGMSLATLLSTKNTVYAYDISKTRIDKINNKISPIKDKDIEEYLNTKKLDLTATTNYQEAFINADYIIISTPTNYDDEKNYFNTSSVEDVIEKIIAMDIKTTIVIKSTIPVGYVKTIRKKYNIKDIFFSPEFLREGKALHDNLYPSRIIVGSKSKKAKMFAEMLRDVSATKDVPIKCMGSMEAEAVKLFANTFLALRVSFFNELDTYAEVKNLNTKDIIDGVSLDPRIGNFYNNPSFGYGGYCLPKDTKQLLANYENVPENLIEAIVKSNDTRKHHIAEMILKKKPKVVGVYRLIMKSDSDNFRASAILSVISILKEKNVDIMIYEPTIKENTYEGFEIVHDLKLFKDLSSIIIANRLDNNLEDVTKIVYTRDIFYKDE